MKTVSVKRPVLLDQHLGEKEMLYPSKGSLRLEMNGASEATLTIGGDADGIPMHAWVKIYNQLGFAGIFRRISRDSNVTVDQTYTLKHGIDLLHDSVWEEETEFTGTKGEFITALLNHQTALIQGPGDSEPRKPWALGTCDDTSGITKKINYDNLLDLISGLAGESGNYYFTYDQTVWPWTVSLVAKPSAVSSEFRLSRNIARCKIKDNDSELCTRLILNVNAMAEDEQLEDDTGISVDQNVSAFRVYDNAAAQAVYGVIVKTADIDISGTIPEDPSDPCPEADAFAADFLARRAAPQLQIQIDGYNLKAITGENWDESRIGEVCRVSLTDYPAPIDERVVSVQYPNIYDAPDNVSVSLANALPTATKSISTTQKSVGKVESENRQTSRQTESLKQHFKITDNSGNVLRQAGMKLDANGVIIYAQDNERQIGSKVQAEADRISLVVDGYGTDAQVKSASIIAAVTDENGVLSSSITISADKVYLNGQTIATSIDAVDTRITNLTTGQTTANKLSCTEFVCATLKRGSYTYTEQAVYDMNGNIRYCLGRA